MHGSVKEGRQDQGTAGSRLRSDSAIGPVPGPPGHLSTPRKENGWPVGPKGGLVEKWWGGGRFSQPGRCPSLGEPTPLRGTAGQHAGRRPRRSPSEGHRPGKRGEAEAARPNGPAIRLERERLARWAERRSGGKWWGGGRFSQPGRCPSLNEPTPLRGTQLPGTPHRTTGPLGRKAEWWKNGGAVGGSRNQGVALRWANRRPFGAHNFGTRLTERLAGWAERRSGRT